MTDANRSTKWDLEEYLITFSCLLSSYPPLTFSRPWHDDRSVTLQEKTR